MRRRPPPGLQVLLLPLLIAAVLAGCGDDAGTGGGDDAGGGAAGDLADELEGREFVAQSVTEAGTDRPLASGTEIRMGFDEGRISASAGCNAMSGDYVLDGDRLVVESLATTMMGCDPPRQEQDEWLAGLLESGPALVLAGPELTLTSDRTVMVLVDLEVADPDRELVGPVWTLDTLIEGEGAASVPSGVTATLRFTDDGRVEVDAGCGGGTTEVAVVGDRLEVGSLDGVDTEPCGEAESEVAVAVGEVLGADPTYAIDGPHLSLEAGDRGLRYRAD